MRVALVTGAARGLGLAWCRHLAASGYDVVLTARTLCQAEDAARSITGTEGRVWPRAMEVTDERQLAETSAWVGETFGRMDLIVNNAGVNPKDYADKARMAKAFSLDALDADEMLEVIRINSIAPLLVVKHFKPLLQSSDRPLVLNISSWLGSVSNLTFGGHYGYVGSKNLLNVFNRAMALELKADGIICVNVNPGWVQTDMGGRKATFTPDEAVANIFANVVTSVTMADTGKFLNFDGALHPW